MRRSYNILLMAMMISMVSCIAEPKLSGEDYSSPESVFMAKVIGNIEAEHKSGELLVELDEATQERIEVEGIEVVEPERRDECCGFGGLFSIEESAVSARMGHDKVQRHIATGAEFITGADSSCLMHMQGVIERDKLPIRTKHIIEILTAQE